MPLTNAEVDAAVPAAGEPNRSLTNTALKELITDVAGKQAASANLDEYAAVNPTAAGLALLDDADAAAQRTTLGLSDLATTTPGAGITTFLATPSSANLRAAITDETGTGPAVFGTSPTIDTPTINSPTLATPTITSPNTSGVSTSSGAEIVTANAMAALAIDVTKGLNTKSIAVDSTFTFSATPATDTQFALLVTNTDTNPHVLTIPSSYSFSLQTAITTLTIGAGNRMLLQWRRTASGYELFGDTSYLNNFSATAAPGVNDDLADGYGPGSLWLDATNNNTYICESNAAGAAVWHQLNGGGGGGAVSISGTPSAGQVAEWTSASAIQGVAVTGSGNYVKATSPTLVTPALGTPSALVLANATGLPVAGGGTGVASLTAYAPVFGGTTGTGAVQSGSVGTAGQVLTSNGAGALPTFQAAPPSPTAFAESHTWGVIATHGATSHTALAAGTITALGTGAGVTTPFNTGQGWPRVSYASAASANSDAGLRCGANGVDYMPGADARAAPLTFRGSFAAVDALTGCRGFLGLRVGTTAPGANEPSTMVNCIGVGYDSDMSQLVFMHNDAAGVCTEVTLNGGTGFPCNSNGVDRYELEMAATGEGGAQTVHFIVRNLSSGVTASGTATTNLPASGSLMNVLAHRNTGANATAATVHVGDISGGHLARVTQGA
jgi:hypothetical protein